MRPKKASGLNASEAREARRGDLLGRRIEAQATPTPEYGASPAPEAQPIRAVIFGSSRAVAGGVSARGHAPVLSLCRALIEAGHDPNTPLEAYRGTTLCLKVRGIGECARLTVKETTRDGKPRFVTYRPGPDGAGSVRGQPYVAQTAAWVAQAADHDREAMLGGVR
jgi:hypothetical protein